MLNDTSKFFGIERNRECVKRIMVLIKSLLKTVLWVCFFCELSSSKSCNVKDVRNIIHVIENIADDIDKLYQFE